MNRKQKLLDKFLENPTSLTASEIISLAKSEGWNVETGKGSHRKLTKGELWQVIPLHNGDCKPIYKKEFAKKIISPIEAE